MWIGPMEKMRCMLRKQNLKGHPEVEVRTWGGMCTLPLLGNNSDQEVALRRDGTTADAEQKTA